MSYSGNARRGNKSRSVSGEEVRIPIAKDKVGLVIGRKGRTLQDIKNRTGVQISIKDNHAHLRGTTEQCNNARELIEEILNVSKMSTSLYFALTFEIAILTQKKRKRDTYITMKVAMLFSLRTEANRTAILSS